MSLLKSLHFSSKGLCNHKIEEKRISILTPFREQKSLLNTFLFAMSLSLQTVSRMGLHLHLTDVFHMQEYAEVPVFSENATRNLSNESFSISYIRMIHMVIHL